MLESDVRPRSDTKFQHYRAQAVFDRLTKWLRGAGITSKSPIHSLRKLFGSEINNQFGLHAASLALRHSDVVVTSRHYVSKREGVTSGLGGVLTASTKVIPIKSEIKRDSVEGVM